MRVSRIPVGRARDAHVAAARYAACTWRRNFLVSPSPAADDGRRRVDTRATIGRRIRHEKNGRASGHLVQRLQGHKKTKAEVCDGFENSEEQEGYVGEERMSAH